jgi:dTMP kinase
VSEAAHPRGRFISLEGGEGVGKSTQVRRLAAALRERGHEVVETREPGGSPGAEAIRALLLEGEAGRWTREAEALLFAAARADHVAKKIAPALAAGAWVLSDRFIDSSLAYQGGADGIGAEAIRTLHQIGSRGLLPDRTFVLCLETYTAAWREFARDDGRLDRFARRSGAYHDRVSEAFHDLSIVEPDRVQLIDASGDADAVTARLLAALDDLACP